MIGLQTNIEFAVTEALASFDEAENVEPYRVCLSHAEVQRMAEHYQIDAANLHELANKMRDWASCDGGVDRDGLYRLSTCNPDGRWDSYEIGGRWDGYIPGARGNVIRAKTLAKADYLGDCLPYFILTPNGEWIEHERYYFGSDGQDVRKEQMNAKDWLAIVRQTLGHWPNHRVVCVDIHC